MSIITSTFVLNSQVLSPAEVIAHPHLTERQAFPEIEHPGRGKVRITAVQAKRKLSQNRSADDIAGTIDGLAATGGEAGHVAEAMRSL